ncbi:MAG TPA: neutral zinc metallopeptidase [Acidimicrobiia bacterium]
MVRFRRDPSGPGSVIDRRGAGGMSGGGGLMKMGAGGGGIVALVLILITLFTGNSDIGGLVNSLAPADQPAAASPLDPSTDPDADLVAFLEDVLQDSQGMWQTMFDDSGIPYTPTNLVVFSGSTQSACGGAVAQSGPHYCPVDQLVYVDLDFLETLQREFGAAGDTAQAYILAHEIGHHVQNQLGVINEVNQIQQSDPGRANEASVSLELQADCFAGVWLSTIRTGTSAAVFDDNDLQEALNAAQAVGDDAIQQQTTGQVNPESFTHGTAEQRYNWLKTGFETGQPEACDTF